MSRRQFLRGAAVLSFALGLRGSAPPCEPKFSGKSVPPPPSGIPSPTESAPPPESTPPPDLETLLKKDVISDEEIEVLARSAVDIFCGSLGCKAADSPDLYRYYGTPITSRSHDLSSHDIYVEVDVIKLPEERGNEAVRVGGANTYLTLAEQAPRQAQAAFIASLVKFLGSDAHQPLEADPPSLEMIDRYFNSASGPVKIEPFGLTGFVIGAELVQEDSQNRPLLMFDAGFDLVVRLYLAEEMIRQENRERPIFADTLGFLATVPQKSQIDELRSRLARSDASDQELYRWLQGGNLEAVVKAVRLEGETERETLNWMLKMGTETITIPDENNLQAKVRAEARAAV